MENRVASTIFHQLVRQDTVGKLFVTLGALLNFRVQRFSSLLIYSRMGVMHYRIQKSPRRLEPANVRGLREGGAAIVLSGSYLDFPFTNASHPQTHGKIPNN